MAKVLSCKDVGVPDCDFVARGESVEEVMRQAGQHGREKHGLTNIPPEMLQKARTLIHDE